MISAVSVSVSVVSASISAANLKGPGPDAQRSAARRLADGTTDAGLLVTGGGGALGSGNVAAGKSPHKSNSLQAELS